MSTAARSIPVPIRQGLARVGRRVRIQGTLRGLGLSLGVLSVGSALGQAADFLLALPDLVRWALWLAWAGLAVSLVVLSVVRPLVRRLRMADLAAVVERGQPGLDGRLVSTVEFLDGRGRPHGSSELIDALASEAENRTNGLDFTQGLPLQPAFRWLSTGLVAAVLLALPMVLRPDPFGTLAARFFAPWRDLERVGRLSVSVQPGDAVGSLGSDVLVRAQVHSRIGGPLPSSAWLEWTLDDGRSYRSRMAPDLEGPSTVKTFTGNLKNLSSSVSYRVRSGGVSSHLYQIKTVEPPSVRKLSVVVEPPSYAQRPSSSLKDPSRINAFEGSRIKLSLKADRPVKRAKILWPSANGPASRHPVALSPSESGLVWTTSLDAQMSGSFTFSLEDADDLLSRPEQPRRLRVVPDQPPALKLGGPGDPLDSRADDVLLVDVSSADDVAVASASLHYKIDRPTDTDTPSEKGEVPALLAGLGSSRAVGQAALNLSELGLKPGDTVRYSVEVRDNYPRPKGPHIVRSEERILKIAGRAKPLIDRQKSAGQQALRDRLEALRKAADENHQKTVQLRYAADSVLRGNGLWDNGQAKALSSRHADARALVDGLESLARDFLRSARFSSLARPTREAAEIEGEAAVSSLGQARRADDAHVRLDSLRQADDRLGSVTKRIDEIIKKFGETARLDDDRRRLRALAERQDVLARRASEMARQNADESSTGQLRHDQEQLRHQVDDLVRKSPNLRSELLAHHAEKARRLARLARDLAERQRQEERQTAHPDLQAEALADLARDQQAIEEDARRLALEVDRPLRESHRAPVNTDALARPADPLARGDVQDARRQLDQAQAELRRLVRDLTDARNDPHSLAQRLARRQDELRRQADDALKTGKTPEEQADRLRPLAEREDTIARLSAAIPAPEIAKEAAKTAVEATQRALEDLKRGKPSNVRAHQTQALSALNQLVKALPDDPDLGLGPRHAEAARALADRESLVQQHLLDMLGQNVASQETLRDEAADLGEQAASLRDQMQGLGTRAQGPINQASNTLQNQAEPTMTRGADQLKQGRLDETRNLQRQSADHIENASRALGDTADALLSDASANGETNPSSALSAAHSAQMQASRELARGQKSSAAQAMRQAADSLRAASQPSPSMARAPGQPGGNANPDPLGLGQAAGVSASILNPARLSPGGHSWGELPGHLRTEILQMPHDQYRPGYSRLIQLYFQEIAADASGEIPREPDLRR